MPTAIKDLVSSKKFITAAVAIVTIIALRLGFSVDDTTATLVVTIFVAAITSQGIADIGKAKAEIENGTTLGEITATAPSRIAIAVAEAKVDEAAALTVEEVTTP